MLAVKGVYDGQVVRLLEPIKVDRPYRVEVTFVEEIARPMPLVNEDNLERFIGIWADFTPEEDQVFQSIMEERAGYFAGRQFDVDDREASR